MKKVKQLKGWVIYENNDSEKAMYGFEYAVIHPENKGIGLLTPDDSDMECNTLEQAIDWINNY